MVKADEVTDWNQQLQQSLLNAGTSPIVASRVTAIVHAAVFDAVNGIERRYTPIHVEFSAPRGASGAGPQFAHVPVGAGPSGAVPSVGAAVAGERAVHRRFHGGERDRQD